MQMIYFTPGPSHLYPGYDTYLAGAMQQQLGSINHRSQAFRDIYRFTDQQLRQLMNIPQTHGIYFASSATEIWEKIILSTVEQHSFHLVNGSFSGKFYDFAKQLGKSPKEYTVPEGNGFDLKAIEIPAETELICTTQNETSTGVQIPEQELADLKDRYPDKLICTDLVSSAPYAQIDFSRMDCAFFSVQKAFGMPPGLGVWIANDHMLQKAIALKQSGISIGAHNTLVSFAGNYQQFETPSTPNVVAIYLLGKIAEDMNRIGIEQLRKTIDQKAALIYQMGDETEGYSALVRRNEHRSKTVMVLETKQSSADIIAAMKQHGMVIGSGYGKNKANQLRIANFPATSIEQVQHLLSKLPR